MTLVLLNVQPIRDPHRNGTAFDLLPRRIERGPDPLAPEAAPPWVLVRHLPSPAIGEAVAAWKALHRMHPLTTPLIEVILCFPGKASIPQELGEAILDTLLDALGLTGHAALMAARPGPHANLLLFIHRIHSATGEATPWLPRRSQMERARRAVEACLTPTAS